VSAFNTTVPSTVGAPVTLTANDATITHTTRNGPNQSALIVQAGGNATITASGVINVTGTASTNAVWAINFSNLPPGSSRPVASVTYDGPATGPGITVTGGPNSTVIQACANNACGPGLASPNPTADAIINATGNLKAVGGPSVFGLDAVAGGTALRP
jgi:hypothetical protein